MARRKATVWQFADATERDAFTSALDNDVAILDDDQSLSYWDSTGGAWEAFPSSPNVPELSIHSYLSTPGSTPVYLKWRNQDGNGIALANVGTDTNAAFLLPFDAQLQFHYRPFLATTGNDWTSITARLSRNLSSTVLSSETYTFTGTTDVGGRFFDFATDLDAGDFVHVGVQIGAATSSVIGMFTARFLAR